jgi:hypothetical protein
MRVSVVVAGGDVEGQLGATAADAIAERGRHGGLLPVERVINVGGWPRGAQVRRTFGVGLSEDSSKKTRQLCAVGRLQNPRPTLLDPAVDRRLVAFGSPTPGPLDTPAQPMLQQRPHPGGMVGAPGEALDHGRDPVQGPQLPGEPVGGGAGEQGLLDGGELLIGRRGAGRLGLRLRRASLLPCRQRACQTLTAWAETSSWRATSARRTPAANSSAARGRRAWSRSRSRCAAGRRGTVGMYRILAWPAAELQLHPDLNPTPKSSINREYGSSWIFELWLTYASTQVRPCRHRLDLEVTDLPQWTTSTFFGDFTLDPDWRQVGHRITTVPWRRGRMVPIAVEDGRVS